MNITYILGNGFDIQLGLRSQYCSFLQEYVHPNDADSVNIKTFKNYLREGSNMKLWSDAERAMGEHLGDFNAESVVTYIEQIADFETKMAQYLEQEQARCSFAEKDKIRKSFLNFLNGSFADILCGRSTEITDKLTVTSRTYNFITFNYTNLLDKVMKCCLEPNGNLPERRVHNTAYADNFGSICHVHGALKSQIIMGVNDESQLSTQGGILLSNRLKRKFIKPYLNQVSRWDWDAQAQTIIEKSDLIAIYGVSYGASDAFWWDKICKWLKKTDSHKLMAFIRDSGEMYNPQLPWDEIDYEEDKRIEVLQNLGLSIADPEFDKLMNQVYLVVNTRRLNLKEIILAHENSKEIVAASNTIDTSVITA